MMEASDHGLTSRNWRSDDEVDALRQRAIDGASLYWISIESGINRGQLSRLLRNPHRGSQEQQRRYAERKKGIA